MTLPSGPEKADDAAMVLGNTPIIHAMPCETRDPEVET
jgi:hypothetical protein